MKANFYTCPIARTGARGWSNTINPRQWFGSSITRLTLERPARIPYNDAVEEALCFGWIDSTVRRLDEDRFAQKFSVRNPKTPYSQTNKERLRELVKQGKVCNAVVATLGDILAEQFVIAPDILDAIKASPQAWANFQALSEPYVRIRIAFIDGARKRPEEFEKRLRYFIRMTEKNRRFGFGGIEKYY